MNAGPPDIVRRPSFPIECAVQGVTSMSSLRLIIRPASVIRILAAAGALYAGAKPEVVLAARTIVFEDFEDETPDDSARAGQIESIDLYGRSSVQEPDASDAL